MHKKTLKIYYETDQIGLKLDSKIIEFVNTLGYSFYASGYNLIKKIRDLAFEKK